MGLVKAALLIGGGVWVVNKLKEGRGCQRNRGRNQPEDGTWPNGTNNTNAYPQPETKAMPPTYSQGPVEDYAYYHQYYDNQPQYRQMQQSEPKVRATVTEIPSKNQLVKGPDTVEKVMTLMRSGQEDKARELLAGVLR